MGSKFRRRKYLHWITSYFKS